MSHAKARIWPWLSDMCHIRSPAARAYPWPYCSRCSFQSLEKLMVLTSKDDFKSWWCWHLQMTSKVDDVDICRGLQKLKMLTFAYDFKRWWCWHLHMTSKVEDVNICRWCSKWRAAASRRRTGSAKVPPFFISVMIKDKLTGLCGNWLSQKNVNTFLWDKAGAASERRGNNLKRSEDFCLKAMARIRLWLSYMCHIRSTAAGGGWCSKWRASNSLDAGLGRQRSFTFSFKSNPLFAGV